MRATAVDALSHGYRTIVPIETTADKHESYHFANLTDLMLKYADVVDVAERRRRVQHAAQLLAEGVQHAVAPTGIRTNAKPHFEPRGERFRER